jgi:hypothetical protein
MTIYNPSVNVRLIGKLNKLHEGVPSGIPAKCLPFATVPEALTQSSTIENGRGMQPPENSPPLGHPDNPVSQFIHLGGEMGN